MFIPYKEFTSTSKTDNYVSYCKNPIKRCRNCVYYGTIDGEPYWLCANRWPVITSVSYCGHCDEFSNNKKINLLKYWMAKMQGFKFKNKAR